MIPKDIKVGICIPSNGEWKSGFGRSLANLCSYYAQQRVGKCKSQKLSLITADGSMLVHLRHKMVVNALQAGCTHVFFLDSDMAFPPDILNKMLLKDKDVLMLNCTTRREPVQPTAHDLNSKRVDSRKLHGLQEISHGGLAVTLVKADVFGRLRPPIFMMEWIPEDRVYCGEDVYFCAKLQEAGVRLYTDHDLSRMIKHEGARSYGYEDVTDAAFSERGRADGSATSDEEGAEDSRKAVA